MTSYVLDTNIISLILRRDAQVLAQFQEVVLADSTILACPVVWYEIRRGLLARDAKGQMQRFEVLFENFTWQDYDQADWALAVDLWTQRRSQGLPIGDADLLIGVFAHNRGAAVVTDNVKDFVGLNLTIENWAD